MTLANFQLRDRGLKGIESCRGIAALLVLFYHICQHIHGDFGSYPFGSFTQVGHVGVDFFFVLSGFIIFYIHKNDINRPNQLWPYLAKRASRVYPFYWVMFGLSLAMVPFVTSREFSSFSDTLLEFLLLPKESINNLNGVSWTLQHEILFYFIFSTLLINRAAGIVVMAAWFVAILVHNFIAELHTPMPRLLTHFNIQFFIGIASAYAITRYNLQKISSTLLSLGIISFLLLFVLEIYDYMNGFGANARIGYGLASALVIVGLTAIELKRGLAVPKLGMLFGKASYAIYLSHLFFFSIYYKIFLVLDIHSYIPIFLSTLALLLLTLCSSCVISHLVEIPASKVARNFLLKKREPR